MKHNLAPKWWSIAIWILAAIVLCGNQLNSQTYTIGDTLTFKVSGLVCSFCAHGLNKGIGKLDYTDKKSVFVDINNQIVKVVILKEPNIEETIKLIKDTGYDISKITHANEVIWKKEK
jgi:copper chaperone CopZ